MRRKQIIVLVAGLMIVGMTVGALSYYQDHQRLGTPGVRFESLPDSVQVRIIMPEDVPDYASESMPVTDEELAMLPHDTSFGRRRYRAESGLLFDLSVVLMGGDQSSIHRPQSCVPAQGWSILSEKLDQVTIEGEQPYVLDYNVMHNAKTVVMNGDSREVESFYVYWFVADGKATASREQRIISTALRMLSAGEVERWAYVSIHVAFPAGLSADVEPELKRFLKRVVPDVQNPPSRT